jgi:glutamyl-tRNA synthetase
MTPVGRLAPSPSGRLHLGNVRTFLWAWLSARSAGGRVLLRVEDLDASRSKPGAAERIVDDLRWLGFDWDGDIVVQSRRLGFYRSVFERLAGKIYPCRCGRAELAGAQSAPHAGDVEPRYPGTCRNGIGEATPLAWRLKVEPGAVSFVDRLYGPTTYDVAKDVGDFVVARGPERPSYQLAVAADDVDQGVTEVVRGDDLLPSAARQILVCRALGVEPPAYGHVPLVLGPDGTRLAKRHGGAWLAELREGGARPERIIGELAASSGLGEGDATPACLLPRWSWARASRERWTLTPGTISAILGRAGPS